MCGTSEIAGVYLHDIRINDAHWKQMSAARQTRKSGNLYQRTNRERFVSFDRRPQRTLLRFD